MNFSRDCVKRCVPSADASLGEPGEPAFDLVEPGRLVGREVHVNTWFRRQRSGRIHSGATDGLKTIEEAERRTRIA